MGVSRYCKFVSLAQMMEVHNKKVLHFMHSIQLEVVTNTNDI